MRCCWVCGFVKDVGEESADALVREREEHGLYRSAADLVRRTGLKPQAALSLVTAGAFDGVTPNRREALWDAGLGIRPGKNGQRAFAIAGDGNAHQRSTTSPDEEKMMGEYRVMGIYPKGHVMEFVRPRLRPEVLPAAAVEAAREGDTVLVAGWPVARQHPRGKSGTVFVTVEDETGDVQLILWPSVFARFRRELESQAAPGSWHGLPLGRDHERHRLPVGAPPDAGSAAVGARLALGWCPVYVFSALVRRAPAFTGCARRPQSVSPGSPST